tara:strand:+ start:115 stop:483 length:369 start_codon:yes stop_codon:yes gene_type:complete
MFGDFYIYAAFALLALFLIVYFGFSVPYIENFENDDLMKQSNLKIMKSLKISENIENYNDMIIDLDEQAGLKLLSLIKNNPGILNNNEMNKTILERFNRLAEFKKNLPICSKLIDQYSKNNK